MRRVIPLAILLGSVAALIGSAPALAAKKPSEPARAAVVQAVSDCRKLTDDAFRLACYDKAAASFDQAEQQGQVVVIDREQVKTVRRQTFGLTLPAFTVFNKGPKEDHVDNVLLTLETVTQEPGGKWVMTDADGVTWAQTDSDFVETPPHKGSTLKVRSGSLGSYFCNIDGQRAIRCQRQR